MSALGQKQTYAVQNAMSALLPIATAKAFFRMSAKGTKADSCTATNQHFIQSSWRGSDVRLKIFQPTLRSSETDNIGATIQVEFLSRPDFISFHSLDA